MPKTKTKKTKTKAVVASGTINRHIPDNKNDLPAVLYTNAMKYVSEAMKRLGLNFAVTGTAVGYGHGLGAPPKFISIALLNEDQITSPKIIQQQVAQLEFDYPVFRINATERLLFLHPNIPTFGAKCVIKFTSVAALPQSARVPYSPAHLQQSAHGWKTTSPVLLVLDALIKAARDIVKNKRKHNKSTGALDKQTQKKMNRVGALIRHLQPGNIEDQELLEGQHKESIPRLLPFIPELALYAPFQAFLPSDDKEVTTLPYNLKHWKPISEEKKHKPTRKRRSLRWVAQLAISAVQAEGLILTALYGDIAKDLYHVSRGSCPEHVDLVVYIPPNGASKFNQTYIQKIIMRNDPASFYLGNPDDESSASPYEYLYYRPTADARKRMGFKFAGFDRHGCKVNIILPPENGLEPLSATTEIKWVDSLPVVPRELLQ